MIQNQLFLDGGPACKGYRLQKLEVFNWGTFDGKVFCVRPGGQTTLLIGQNGSGKSTLVDALLTLLVRPGVRNFNVAAGASKRERDERTYVKGAYDRNGDEENQGIQVKYLRPKGEPYSVILACFHNAQSGKTFTIAQLLYLAADLSVEKVYCFSEDDRSIQADFHRLNSTDTILKTLQARGLRATRKYVEYEGWFHRVARFKSKAMEVFNQTVAVKDIQRLNDFVRNHMLEAQDWGEKVDGLLGHFTQLREAHQSLVRARKQSELLEPISQIGSDFQGQSHQLESAERLMAAADAFFSQKVLDLFGPQLLRLREQLEAMRARKDLLAQEIREALDQCYQLQQEIEGAGGDRLRQLPLLINTERAYVHSKQEACNRYHDAVRRSGMDFPVNSPNEFAVVQQRSSSLMGELTEAINQADASRVELGVVRHNIRQALDENRRELEGLNRRRENLPEWCVGLRNTLCEDLGLSVKDLPFAAELIAVKPAERSWEATIENVLRSFALSLLVPEKLYHSVGRYVDGTRLSVGGEGQRLVYLHVGEQFQVSDGPAPSASSLLRKLAFRDGHSLLPWVKVELGRRFDYQCCDTAEEFLQSRGLAMTRNRHVKAANRRHEKDDRQRSVDPRHFVLGWDNREKKQRIAEEIFRLQQRDLEVDRKIASLEGELTQFRERLAAVTIAASIASFSDIDFRRHEQEIALLEQEKRLIEEQSDTIQLLKQRLKATETRREALEKSRDDAVARQRELENHIGDAERLIANATADLQRRAMAGTLATHRETFAELDALFAEPPLTAENFAEQKDAFRSQQQERIVRLRHAIDPIKERLLDAMSRFLRAFPEETDLDGSVAYLESFLGLQQRILEEDLPRHERRFKERLNEKVIQEIGLFRGELERERRSIEDKIETLNLSLRRLEYRRGMHIQLEPRPVRDPEILDFQRKLRECIEGSFEDSPEANEARFLRIQELIVQLADEQNRRWRDKVVDVRRWFDFVASVIDRHTSKTVSVYQDSSGQSGGEKAKLAFTILVAAIAYQYDLDPDQPLSDRFHFVVVDEMFSKVDDQYAEYALDLFRQFGLQLLIVAPLDAKARVTQPYVGCYLHVNKRNDRSEIFEMTAREFEESLGAVGAGRAPVLVEGQPS